MNRGRDHFRQTAIRRNHDTMRPYPNPPQHSLNPHIAVIAHNHAPSPNPLSQNDLRDTIISDPHRRYSPPPHFSVRETQPENRAKPSRSAGRPAAKATPASPHSSEAIAFIAHNPLPTRKIQPSRGLRTPIIGDTHRRYSLHTPPRTESATTATTSKTPSSSKQHQTGSSPQTPLLCIASSPSRPSRFSVLSILRRKAQQLQQPPSSSETTPITRIHNNLTPVACALDVGCWTLSVGRFLITIPRPSSSSTGRFALPDTAPALIS